jgi:hypothetical protein
MSNKSRNKQKPSPADHKDNVTKLPEARTGFTYGEAWTIKGKVDIILKEDVYHLIHNWATVVLGKLTPVLRSYDNTAKTYPDYDAYMVMAREKQIVTSMDGRQLSIPRHTEADLREKFPKTAEQLEELQAEVCDLEIRRARVAWFFKRKPTAATSSLVAEFDLLDDAAQFEELLYAFEDDKE